jgi:hypothetical protein
MKRETSTGNINFFPLKDLPVRGVAKDTKGKLTNYYFSANKQFSVDR